jgi:aryl-alcohol dehydrogenase-like predicted oxidoreductase
MVKRKISRKKFLSTAVAGLAGLKLFSDNTSSANDTLSAKRKVGKTGIVVSPVCFGASRTSEESLIRYAIDKGLHFIDTGRNYANGNNEKLVGRAIAPIRKDIVVQSKLRLDPNELPSEGKGKKGADEIRDLLNSRLEASLKALNTDYIDILLYHDASQENLLFHPEVIKFYSGLKSSGVIKAHGFSAHTDYLNLHERNNREVVYDIMMVPFNHKGSFIHSVTGRYSEWDQEKLVKVLEMAGEKGIGIIAMKTCSAGMYSPSDGSDPNYSEAVRWVLRHPFVSSAAVAMANFEEVDEHVSWLT